MRRLVRRIESGGRLAETPAEDRPDGWPEASFKAPSFRRLVRQSRPLIVLAAVTSSLALLAVVLLYALEPGTVSLVIAGLGLLLLLPTGLLIVHIVRGYLLAESGRIVLEGERLVEYGRFQRVRAFTYDQVCQVNDRRARVTIRYYARDKHGQIDDTDVRQTALIDVHDAPAMVDELRRRCTAPPPTRKAQRLQ